MSLQRSVQEPGGMRVLGLLVLIASVCLAWGFGDEDQLLSDGTLDDTFGGKVKGVFDPYNGNYGEDDPRHSILTNRRDPGGTVVQACRPDRPRSPFDNLPATEFPMMTRLLWWAARYAYDTTAHYITDENVVENGHHVEEIASWAKEHKARADASATIITPDLKLRIQGSNPSIWYCLKYHPASFCESEATQYYHITFRGMQLFRSFTVAPLGDLINMRGKNNMVSCRFRFPTLGEITITVSSGACVLTKSLVRGGLLKALVSKLSFGHQYFFSFHGLSYGATVAQSFALFFAEILRRFDALPVQLNDVKIHTMLFGAPRAGNRNFATQFDDNNIYADQFVMYSYYGNGLTQSSPLAYDAMGFWPSSPISVQPEDTLQTAFYPVGNMHSLMFYYTDDEKKIIVTEVRHDLFSHQSAPFQTFIDRKISPNYGPRRVPDADQDSFFCLHMFHLYHSFFRQHYYSAWEPREHFKGCFPQAVEYIPRELSPPSSVCT